MVVFSSLFGIGALLLPSFIQQVNGVSLQVSTDGGNASSPLLYGFMFEVCTMPVRTGPLIYVLTSEIGH